MEITTAYAAGVGGVFVTLVCLAHRSKIKRGLHTIFVCYTQHLVYPPLLRRHRHIGPWSRADVLIPLLYTAINGVCLLYRFSDIPTVGLRAARISLVNMIPAFASPHLSFAADVCGISLDAFRKIHMSTGLMSFVFLLVHVLIVAAGRIPFPLRRQENMWATIVRR
jgi:hypothetical protein